MPNNPKSWRHRKRLKQFIRNRNPGHNSELPSASDLFGTVTSADCNQVFSVPSNAAIFPEPPADVSLLLPSSSSSMSSDPPLIHPENCAGISGSFPTSDSSSSRVNSFISDIPVIEDTWEPSVVTLPGIQVPTEASIQVPPLDVPMSTIVEDYEKLTNPHNVNVEDAPWIRWIYPEDGGSPTSEEVNKIFNVDSPFFQEDESIPVSDPFTPSTDEPLYSGAPITQWESLAAILTFIDSERITGVGVVRLLSLISLHLPEKSNFFRSKKDLLKLLDGNNKPVTVHYFCNTCLKSRTSVTDLCDTCTKPDKCVYFFISFSVEAQLKRLFERPGFLEDIDYRSRHPPQSDGCIRDIYDGEIFKAQENRMDTQSTNVTFMWNCDGMQAFGSSPYSLNPFYFAINELAPDKRFKPQNILIAGIWGSAVKPHPNLFLQPIYKEMKNLEMGISVICHGEVRPRKVRAYVLCGTCDSPARASFLNMKTHSGYFSCPQCLVKGSKTTEVVSFPNEEDMQPRSMEQYKNHVRWAVENRVLHNPLLTNEDQCCGIKGPTLLSYLVSDMFSSTAIDSMHCLYLGIMRSLIYLWIDSDLKKEPFSLYYKIDVFNERLRLIFPPHFIQRMTQGLDKLCYWKASELRYFLFYIGPIILQDLLPDNYYNHFLLLVQGTSLLNSTFVTSEDLLIADALLEKFRRDYETLYGVRYMSHNVHLSGHLADIVRNLGPLWCNNCFGFEDLNGKLLALIHGSKDPDIQIHGNFNIIAQIPTIADSLPESPTKAYCKSVMRKTKNYNVTEKVADGIYCVGLFSEDDSGWIHVLFHEKSIIENFKCLKLFKRLLQRRTLYVSASYGKCRRVSSYVKYYDNGTICHGDVQEFVKVIDCHCGYHYINDPCLCPVRYFAIIQDLETEACLAPPPFQRPINYIFKCKPLDQSKIIPVEKLITVLSKTPYKDGEFFLCEPLNPLEME